MTTGELVPVAAVLHLLLAIKLQQPTIGGLATHGDLLLRVATIIEMAWTGLRNAQTGHHQQRQQMFGTLKGLL
jgi:hypothetical protein